MGIVDHIDCPDDVVAKAVGTVVAVSFRRGHDFSKTPHDSVRLLAGLGVEGDAHLGKTDQHRSHVRNDPTRPNLRQVHLIQAELFDELHQRGFEVRPGDLGENITTTGIDLLALPAGAKLHLGATAVVEVTGLRNPCVQIDKLQKGLMAATLAKDEAGNLIRKTGVMSIVLVDGEVRPNDPILVERPPGIQKPLPVV